MASTIEIFFCYAREDEPLRKGLEKQLRVLQRQGLINVWHDRVIGAGTDWEREIDIHLNRAHIILLLVSPDFMVSEYCYGVEMKRAMERHEKGEARVIPIILRPVYWESAPFGKLQALPTNAKPVMARSWYSLDDAFFNVAEGIRKAVEQMITKPSINPLATPVKALTEEPAKLTPRSREFTLLRTFPGHSGWVGSIAVSDDWQTIASGSFDQTIKVWNLSTGQLLHTFTDHSGLVYSVAISADGQTLASGSEDSTIKIWNLLTPELLHTFTDHSGPVYSVAISADGQTLASGGFDQTIKVWNLNTRQLLHTLRDHTSSVRSVAISADGQTLASGSEDSTIKVWNLSTGQLLYTLTDHSGPVYSVAISADGQTLASGSEDSMIKIWSLRTGQLLRTLMGHPGHTSGVCSIAISLDEKTLASGSFDQTIKVWNLHTGQLLHTLTGHSWYVYNVAISHDGKLLVSGGDKTINVWGKK